MGRKIRREERRKEKREEEERRGEKRGEERDSIIEAIFPGYGKPRAEQWNAETLGTHTGTHV